MSAPTRNEPYPYRDAIVDKTGHASREFDQWLNEHLLPTVTSAPSQVASVNLPSQNAGVGLTPFAGDLTLGVYRVTYYAQILTPAGVSSSLQLTLNWTYNGVAQTEVFTALATNLTTSHQALVFPVRIGASPVSYTLTYASNPAAAMVYSAYLSLELVESLS